MSPSLSPKPDLIANITLPLLEVSLKCAELYTASDYFGLSSANNCSVSFFHAGVHIPVQNIVTLDFTDFYCIF